MYQTLRLNIMAELLIELISPTLEEGDFYHITKSSYYGISLLYSHHFKGGSYSSLGQFSIDNDTISASPWTDSGKIGRCDSWYSQITHWPIHTDTTFKAECTKIIIARRDIIIKKQGRKPWDTLPGLKCPPCISQVLTQLV